MNSTTIKNAKSKVKELEDKLRRNYSPYLVEQLKKANEKLKSIEEKLAGTQQKLI